MIKTCSYCQADYQTFDTRQKHCSRACSNRSRKGDVLARLLAKVDRTGECWLWTSAVNNNGYGLICIDGRAVSAHRVMYALMVGPIPEGDDYHGVCVLHHCDNPRCVNPAHLFLGSQQDNINDMLAKGRGYRFKHARGEQHTASKLTNADVLAIRAMTGSNAEASRMFQISEAQVCRIKKRQNWTHL